MVKVYVVRHCEAFGNVARVFQGNSDSDVSERGLKQLEYLAERFKDVQLDAVYTSPLKRARMTADAMNRHHGLEVEIVNDLIEINAGVIEGVSWSDFHATMPELSYAWNMEPHLFDPPEGEAMCNVFDRVWNAFNDIVSKNEDKTVALASHGCAIRNLMCQISGLPIEELSTMGWCDNTGVTLLECDGKGLPVIQYFNDLSHLTPDCMPPDRIRDFSYVKPSTNQTNNSSENKGGCE